MRSDTRMAGNRCSWISRSTVDALTASSEAMSLGERNCLSCTLWLLWAIGRIRHGLQESSPAAATIRQDSPQPDSLRWVDPAGPELARDTSGQHEGQVDE